MENNMSMFLLGMKIGGAVASISFLKDVIKRMEMDEVDKSELIIAIDEIIKSLR